jgi:hypothetical protein
MAKKQDLDLQNAGTAETPQSGETPIAAVQSSQPQVSPFATKEAVDEAHENAEDEIIAPDGTQTNANIVFNDDEFGGNDNNRRVAERIRKELAQVKAVEEDLGELVTSLGQPSEDSADNLHLAARQRRVNANPNQTQSINKNITSPVNKILWQQKAPQLTTATK